MEATPGKNRLGVFVYDGEQKHPPAFQTGDSVYAAGEVLDLRPGETQHAKLKVYPYQSLVALRELEQRGHKLMAEKKYAEAIEAFSGILRDHPANRDALIGRGYAYRSAGDFGRSIADFEAALTASGEDQQAEFMLADLLATSPVEGTRDGKRALPFAQRALAHARRGYQYDTSSLVMALEIVASAYAETGDFTNAVAAEQEAIELAPESRKADMQKRLQLYQANKPFRREPPVVPASDAPASKPANQGAAKSPPLVPLVFKAVESPPASPTTNYRAVATPNTSAGLTQLDALDLKFPSDATWHLVPQTKANLNAAATLGDAVK
jgi:tetratricopeptide (TPR) repeat protein